MRAALGVDIGGTSVKFGFVDESGRVLRRWDIPTDTSGGGAHILEQVARSIRETLAPEEAQGAAGIGLAVPGPVDAGGLVNRCVNLGWGRVKPGQELERRTGLPVIVGNDAAMAALGEMERGAARGADTFVMLTLGTGVGGGVVVNRRALCGRDGSAGEAGHILVEPTEKRPCACGNRGCLEQYASARALSRAAAEYLQSHPNEKTLLRGDTPSARDVMDAARAGDGVALRLALRLFDALGRGLGILAAILNPDLFLLGGGLAGSGDFLLSGAREAYRRYAFHAAKDTPILLAALGADAAVVGCAMGILRPALPERAENRAI